MKTLFQRWEEKVNRTGACWEWTACRDSAGYGRIKVGRKVEGAHRVAWMLTRGPIPDGTFVLHHCDNPTCVKPSHLFLGTSADNMRDMEAKGRGNQPCGEQNGSAKLSNENVLSIRELYASGEKQIALAREFGVSQALVSSIVNHKHWVSR